MFGNKRRSHHRSEFFLGNMEEAFKEQHRKPLAPSEEKENSRKRRESREEKRERESGLLPVWEPQRPTKTKKTVKPDEKKTEKEKKVLPEIKEEPKIIPQAKKETSLPKIKKEKPLPKQEEEKNLPEKEDTKPLSQKKEAKKEETKSLPEKNEINKEKKTKSLPKVKKEQEKKAEKKSKKTSLFRKKLSSDDEVEFISTDDVEINPSAPFIMPENTEALPNIVPVVDLAKNPSLAGKPKGKKVGGNVPVLKGMQNPEAMPGYRKEKKEIKGEKPKEEKKEEKKLNPFDPKELEQIFHKEEEGKNLLEQSEEALQKAVTKGRAWINKQASEAENKEASTAVKVSQALAKKATDKAEKTLNNLKSKRIRKARANKAPVTTKAKADPYLSSPEQRELQEKVKAGLDGMYGVFENKDNRKNKKMKPGDALRYAVLFLCIFGFVSAGAFVFTKLYDYYRSYVVYSGLQDLVASDDYFKDEYLKKTSSSVISLTPQSILNGETNPEDGSDDYFSDEQQNLVNKISQLKKINSDTVGWIKVPGTVVNYPVVWSELKNYYLHRDFYGKTLSGGTIYVDERNQADITQNRNTVIYGHNMTDGSMFASLHDFSNASTFFNSTIEITTEEGVFVYTPFSVHKSDAYDNYFETDFVNDEDFIAFCEQMQFISLYETDFTFNKDSRIITLSTCGTDPRDKNQRFAVHAVLTKVIR